MHRNFSSWNDCRNIPCPQCGKKSTDCSITTDGLVSACRKIGEGQTQKDGRTVSYKRVSQCGEAGKAVKKTKPQPSVPRLKTREVEMLIKQHRTALSPDRLKTTAKDLGVSPDALLDVGMGYDADSGCVSFPMYDGRRRPVGIRLRRRNPRRDQQRYMCVLGSQNGLFIPKSYDPKPIDILDDSSRTVLVLPEGPTDVAAALDLGQQAVGRFSNSGGQQDLRTLLDSAPGPIELVIVADRDDPKHLKNGAPYFPGWEGALGIAVSLYSHKNVSRIKLTMPPDNTKDLREWLRGGGKAQALICFLDCLNAATSDWLSHKRDALNRLKELTIKLVRDGKAPGEALSMARAQLLGRAAG